MATTYTNTLATPDQVGKIQDVSNAINNLDKDETPFITAIGRGAKAKNVYTEFETRNLPTYGVDTNIEQGHKAVPSASVQPTLQGNYQMIFSDTASVTTTAQAQAQYNIKEKLADQIRLKTTAMKIAMNKRAQGNYPSQEPAAGNNNVGKFAGALAWMTGDNVARGATGADGGFNGTTKIVSAYTAGTARALTEEIFLNTIKEIARGRKMANYDAFMNADNRSFVSRNFTGIAGLTQNVDNPRVDIGLQGSVGFMKTDYGIVTIHYDHTTPDDAIPIIQKKLWKLRDMEPWKTQTLGTTGLSKEKQVWTSTTLEATNQAGSGAVVDIDVS
ncbi:SU10 major capsid protein [Litorimonas sp.]|uniref:SU10 major capsid protein n=1 Tax=Litorimonas sp. TaxID=1892381 RepID=UPI003A86EA9F